MTQTPAPRRTSNGPLEVEEDFDPVALGLIEAGSNFEAENRDDSLEKDKLDCPAKRSPPHSPRSSSFPVISATHRSANCDKTDSGRRSSSDESHKLKIEDHAVDQTSIANHREDETIAANGGPPFVTGDTPNDVAAQESSEPCPVDNLHNGSASSTLPSSDLRTDRSNIPCRSALVKLVQLRRPGRRAARIGIRIIPRKPRPDERFVLGPITSNLGENITVFNPEVVPGFQQEFTTIFGTEAVEKLAVASKLHASSGQYLPIQVRDLFPTLSEPVSALGMANALRTEHDLPRLTVNKGNRIALRRAVAQMREKLYVELISALSLPLAPTALETDDEMDGEVEKPSLSMTPTNLNILSKTLPKAFPLEKAAIQAFLAVGHEAAYGEKGGKVFWQGGVGTMSGTNGDGYREKAIADGAVHVFVDHSNILYGLIHALYADNSTSLPPRHLRTVSLPALSLLLRRGRPTPPGTLHLVASSPLKQNLDALVRLGWEVSVLKRVEVYEDEVQDATAMHLVPRPQTRISGVQDVGSRRYKEQGVDEILHLKLLQALNSKPAPAPRGSTIVLATGDARGGQFNRDGFVGGVREALNRGWGVELWSFGAGLSRSWRMVAKRERWFEKGFEMRTMDEWGQQLVEVAEEGREW